jgi:hypothetical protein
VTGPHRLRWRLFALLVLATVSVSGWLARAGVAAVPRDVRAGAQRTTREIAHLDHRTSETSYRAAVADGGARLLARQGRRLQQPLRCASTWTDGRTSITCRGRTTSEEEVILTGTVQGNQRPDPQQSYQLSVDRRQVWQGTCLGENCPPATQ